MAPNFLYRLAVHLQAQEVAQGETFLALPFVNGSLFDGAGIPEVQLPGDVTAGVDPLAAKDWALGSIQMPSVEAVQSLQSGQPAAAGCCHRHGRRLQSRRSGRRNVARSFESARSSVTTSLITSTSLTTSDISTWQGCLKDKTCTSGETENQYLTNPGHGTHCAGHVGAVANNSLGIRGVGGNVQVMALKFFYDYTDGENAGAGDDAAAIQSIDYAIAHGVKVISASWGGRMTKADADSIRAQRRNATRSTSWNPLRRRCR